MTRFGTLGYPEFVYECISDCLSLSETCSGWGLEPGLDAKAMHASDVVYLGVKPIVPN